MAGLGLTDGEGLSPWTGRREGGGETEERRESERLAPVAGVPVEDEIGTRSRFPIGLGRVQQLFFQR